MRPSALDLLALVCPRCRRGAKAHRLALAEVATREGEAVLQGVLACLGCGARYPILDGVPCVLRDLGGWLADARSAALWRDDLAPCVAALVESVLPLGAVYAQTRADLAAYLDSHFGEGGSPLLEEARAGEGALRLDLGCATGGLTAELAHGAALAVGLDTRLDFLRAARARVPAALFVAGDALDPPFEPGVFSTVAAWNLLDNVSVPFHLLGQADALLAPGGLLLLSTPYAYGPLTEPGEQIDGVAQLRAILEGRAPGPVPLAYTILREVDGVPWRLRVGARKVSEFSLHVLRARKPPGEPPGASASDRDKRLAIR